MRGLSKARWGPAAWTVLHSVAHTYPRAPTAAERRDAHTFLHLYAQHLPCPQCRRHARAWLERELPTPDAEGLRSRSDLVRCLHALHNDVNRRLGKAELTLRHHCDDYEGRSASATTLFPLVVVGACGVLVVLALVQRRIRDLRRAR